MGKQINQSIIIDAKIKTTLEGMNEVVSKLNKGLREGTTKIDLTKGVGNSISKQIETFKTEYQKFAQLTKSGKVEFGDSKEAIRSGEQMIKTFSELKRIIGNFEDLSVLDAKKMFPEAFDSRVDSLGKKLSTLRNNLMELDSKKNDLTNAQAAFDELKTKQELLQNSLTAEMAVKIDTTAAEQELNDAKKRVQELREELKRGLGAKLNETDATKNTLEARRNEILNARKARGVTVEPLSGAQVKAAGGSKEQQTAASQALKLYNAEKAELKEIEEALKRNSAEADKYRKALTGADTSKLTDLADKAKASAGEIEEITNALERQERAEKDLAEANDKKAAQEKNTATIKKNLDDTTKAVEAQEQKVTKLKNSYEQLKTKINPEELTKAFKEIGIDFTPEMAKNSESIQQLQEQLNDLDEVDHKKLIASLQKMGLSADTAEDYVRELKGELGGIRDTAADISASAREMDNLKNQVLQFFSLTNSVQLFKRAVTSALNTVKELDKTMTEAAVVTEFDVSDMWDKLPQYAKHAQELGVSINGMYQATTLYYQQGLKTNEAMALGIETMKMGKIASMDSTEATKAMTAALRGFNMELNETSATRVNDVYSQLAAVTAADTNQIATAMEKTASIAAAANMEFESTAAFLAQIIETTQEAPETAGTALKTIIARFSEVKSLREQGLASGKDSEGEGIDVNKIQTALKTVGISMEGFFAGTEGLDSILLKLAENWNGLDFETQRYIATMAAGSRQQSRFIAMMSDYKRTAELVGEAQNSAGASTRQFEKTLESMESKLQRLENAWNEFLMGLANNEILKGAVDLVTSLVTGINDLTDGLSQGVGPLKTIVSLLTTLGALSLGKTVLSGGLGWMGRQMGIKGAETEAKKFTLADRSALAGQQKGWRKGLGFMSNPEATEKVQKRAEKSGRAKIIRSNRKALKQAENQGQFQQILGKSSDLKDKTNYEAYRAADQMYGKLIKEGKTAEEAAAGATKEFEKQGGVLVNTAQKAEIAANSSKKLGVDFKALGGSIMGVGAALGALSALLSAFGEDEAAESAGKIAGGFMAVGAIVSALGPIFQSTGFAAFKAGLIAGAGWAWTLVIGIVLIGLIALIATIASSTKTAAEEMAELDSQTKALADAADKAEESMQNLADTQKDLANLKNTMDGLIKGTDEWNKALIESNNKVLELLDTYPELAKYVDEEDGYLTIQSAGWNMIAKKQMDTYINASAARWALAAKKTTVSGRMIDEDKNMSDVERKSRSKALGIQGDIQIEEFYRQVVASNPTLKGNEFSEYSATALAAEGLGYFVQALDKAAASIELNEQAYQEYADMMGITLKEAKEAEDAIVKNTLAASRIQKTSASRMENMNQQIAKKSPEEQELIKALLSKDGSKITNAQLDTLTDSKIEEIGISIGMFGHEIDGLIDSVGQIRDTFGNLNEKIGPLGITGNLATLLSNANYQIFSGITSKIDELKAQGASSDQINALFEQLLAGKSEEQRIAILEALAVTDWHSVEDLNDTFNTFAKEGLIDPAVANDLNSEMKELAGAVSDNTVAQNQQKGFQLKDIMDQILSGELTNIMSTDQKDALVDSGAFTEDEFQNVGTDEWVFNGDMYSRVVNLYGEINDKTEGTIKDDVEEYRIGAAVTEAIDNLGGEYSVTATEDSTFTSFEAAEAYAKQFGQYKMGYTGIEEVEEGETGDLSFKAWKEGPGRFKVSDGATEQELQQAYLEDINYLISIGDLLGTAQFSGHEAILQMKNGFMVDEAQVNAIGDQLSKITGGTWDVETSLEEKQQRIIEWYDLYYNNNELKKNAQQSIIDRAKGVGSTTETTAAYGYADTTDFDDDQKRQYQENYEKGIETRYTYYSGAAFMDQLTEGMTSEEIKKYDTVLKALASDLGQVAKKTKMFAENMTNLSENLSESKRGTVEYGEALDQAYANIGALFGKDAKWAKDLNISKEIIEGVTKGDKKSFNQMVDFIKESAQKGINEINWGENVDASAVSEKLANIQAFVDVQPGEEGYAEMLAFFQSLSEDGRKEFAWIAQLAGVTLSFEYDKSGKITSVMGGASNLGDLFGNYSGGGGGGGGSEYENKYDKLHNELEEINDLLRERERLERRYQNLVNRGVDSHKNITNSQKERVDNLQEEIEKQKYIQEQRGKQIEENIAKNPKMEKYIYFETNENGERSIRINWEEINKVKDSELGEKIDKFYDQNKEWIDSYNEAADAIVEGEDAIYDAMQEGKDEYLDFENQVKEAIEKQYQDEIDKLSEVNDSINNTNSKIIESMQEQISAARQERDNAKTEQEIEDKQRRLAYLQQDTSGANALEIMQLQKEIDEQTEDYTDTLIDQKISELQKQNDQAAEQRQRQIDLAQAQLDQYVKSGEIWREVNQVISEGFNDDGTIKVDSKLYELLQNAEGYQELSEIGQMNWLKGLETTVAQGLAWREGGGVLSTFWNKKQIEFTTADGERVTGTVQEDGTVIDTEGNVYEDVSWEGGNVFKTNEIKKIKQEQEEEEEDKKEEEKKPTGYWKEYYTYGKAKGTKEEIEAIIERAREDDLREVDQYFGSLSPSEEAIYLEKYGSLEAAKEVEKRYIQAKYDSIKNNLKPTQKWVAYKTGGLADFTGPAWLDGTKSKPEYILNADQTKAFFTLVDVLSGLQSNTSKSTEKTGDNTYDIDINVESIGSDYDVEQLAETVKRLINEDARYRNNNAINLMR